MHTITRTLTRRAVAALIRRARGRKPRRHEHPREPWQSYWFGMWGKMFLPLEPYEPPPAPDPGLAAIADLLRRYRLVA